MPTRVFFKRISDTGGPNTDIAIIPTDIESVHDNGDGTCTICTDGGNNHKVSGSFEEVTGAIWPSE